MSQSKISDFYNVRKKQNSKNINRKSKKSKEFGQTDILSLPRTTKVVNEETKNEKIKLETKKSNKHNTKKLPELTNKNDFGVEKTFKCQTVVKKGLCVEKYSPKKIENNQNESVCEGESKKLEKNIFENTDQHSRLKVKKNLDENNSKLTALERISDKAYKHITSTCQTTLLTPTIKQTASVVKKILFSPVKEPLKNNEKIQRQVQTPKKQLTIPSKTSLTPTKRPRISPMKLLEDIQSPSKKLHLEGAYNFPPSPSKFPVFSPIKQSPEKACTKFKYLAQACTTTLPLPHTYISLYHLFSNLDLVISIFTTRQQICTFDKVKGAVDEMDKKYTLNANSLGQVITVDGSLYDLKQEKGLPTFGEGRSSEFQLTIEPIIENGNEKRVLSCQKLAQRKESFRKRLMSIVMSHHKNFLKHLSLPIQLDESLLERWHPRFKLESVPPIEPTPLPKPPLTSAPIITAAKALEFIKAKPDPKIKEALQKIIKAKEEKIKVSVTTTITNKTTSNATQGISTSLLEKIRRKESIREAEAMVAIPSRTTMLQRLPTLAKILRQYFMNQKRPAITRDDVIKCFCDSYNSKISPLEATTHLNLLLELLPWWLKEVRVSKGAYVRMIPSVQMADVYEALKTAS